MNKLRHGRTAVDDTSHCTSTDWSDYNVHNVPAAEEFCEN